MNKKRLAIGDIVVLDIPEGAIDSYYYRRRWNKKIGRVCGVKITVSFFDDEDVNQFSIMDPAHMRIATAKEVKKRKEFLRVRKFIRAIKKRR